MTKLNKNDRLVDWRNHTWYVINPVKQTIRGATGSSDGQYRYYQVAQDGRVYIGNYVTDHYPADVVSA